MHPEMEHLKTLPVSERLTLVQELWDSIEDARQTIPLQEWQRELARVRLAELQGNEAQLGLSRDEVKSLITRRH